VVVMNDLISKDDRMWGMLCHFGAYGGHLIPFGNIIIPLIIWIVKRETSSFVDYHGKESLNFQITIFIYFTIAFVLAFLLVGFLLMIPLWIFSLVMVLIAGMKANEGQLYHYPITIRFIK
jgi:uncharacterized Tic20 family protein